MNDWLERSRLLLGDEKLQKLQKAHVLLRGKVQRTANICESCVTE